MRPTRARLAAGVAALGCALAVPAGPALASKPDDWQPPADDHAAKPDDRSGTAPDDRNRAENRSDNPDRGRDDGGTEVPPQAHVPVPPRIEQDPREERRSEDRRSGDRRTRRAPSATRPRASVADGSPPNEVEAAQPPAAPLPPEPQPADGASREPRSDCDVADRLSRGDDLVAIRAICAGRTDRPDEPLTAATTPAGFRAEYAALGAIALAGAAFLRLLALRRR